MAFNKPNGIFFTSGLSSVQFHLILRLKSQLFKILSFLHEVHTSELMVNDKTNNVIEACTLLKHKFFGVFAVDNFLTTYAQNKFIILSVPMFKPSGKNRYLIWHKNEKSIINLTSIKVTHNSLVSSLDDIQTVSELNQTQTTKN